MTPPPTAATFAACGIHDVIPEDRREVLAQFGINFMTKGLSSLWRNIFYWCILIFVSFLKLSRACPKSPQSCLLTSGCKSCQNHLLLANFEAKFFCVERVRLFNVRRYFSLSSVAVRHGVDMVRRKVIFLGFINVGKHSNNPKRKDEHMLPLADFL